MSAIAGIIHFDGEPVSRHDLERMGQALEAFGRDAQRVALGRGAGFVVRRSQMTPEDRFDRQPLAMGGQDIFLFDGRLDNRPELIRRLGLTETIARLKSDSDLAAQAWSHWGRDSLIQMIGVFSVAHWNAAANCLTLAGSAPTSRTLYAHRRDGRLYFASAPHALFALPQIPRALNEAALGDFLYINFSSNQTLWQDIHAVNHSHWTEYRFNDAETRRYWTPDRGRQLRFKREEEGWEALQALFEEVVQSQLRSAHPIGMLMSGGLDSAAVAGQAAVILSRGGKVLHGYTSVPAPDAPVRADNMWYSNERSRVEQIARLHPNLRPHLVHAGGEPVFATQTASFAAAYGPSGAAPTGSSSIEVIYRRAVSDGVRVLLDGGAGNGSVTYDGIARLRSLLRRGRWLSLYRELKGLRRFRGKVEDIVRRELMDTPVVDALRWLRHPFRRRRQTTPPHSYFINPMFAASSGASARLAASGGIFGHWQKMDSWEQRAWAFGSVGLPPLPDAALAMHGLDRRSPLADRRIVEFTLSLPEEYFLSHGIERRLVRMGLAHLIPESIRLDPTRGRQDADWAYRLSMESEAVSRQLVELASDPQVSGYLDVSAMQAVWNKFPHVAWDRATGSDELLCHHLMTAALTVGGFVRWFEQRN
jgi:asparagine synthase (glutamine-hydrolysing)